jgi:predicted patatin/cPLA2 family phospholipase
MLVLEGGGMRAGFVAGVLMALMDKGWTGFDAAVAVSASVPTLAYFASGQRKVMETVWRQELCTRKLVCYHNLPAASLALSTQRPLVNIDYLVDEVFKERYPLDLAAMKENGIRCRFAATRVPEGTLELLDPLEHDIYTLMKACLAVPGCYPGTICLGPCEYLDGGAVHPLPFPEEFTRENDKLLAILTKPEGGDAQFLGFWERLVFWRYFHHHTWMEEKLVMAEQSYRDQVAFLKQEALTRPMKTVAIHPQEPLPANFLTRNELKLNSTIDLGYQRVVELEDEIERFFQQAERPLPAAS